jgi:hypothetical protein
MYIHDTESKHQNRHAVMPLLDPTTLDRLLTMMYNINPYVKVFKMARDMMAIKGAPTILKLRFIASRTKDARRYNLPIADEVTPVGNGFETINRCDVVVTQQLARFNAFPNYMWDTWLYIIYCYFLMVRMDGIRIFCSMVLLLMQIWMKTMWKNLSIKESIAM